MLFVTHKRLYLLKNLDYIHYSKYFGYSHLEKLGSKKYVSKQINFEVELKNPDIKSFWDNAPTKLKSDLLKSYRYAKSGRNQTLNVETDNWAVIDFFNKQIEQIKSLHNYTSLVRLNGTHQLNLRFANIHLCVDQLGDRLIYQIHWDEYYPHNPIDSIKHHLGLNNNIFAKKVLSVLFFLLVHSYQS